jgi:hypothetical protein
MDQFLSSSRIRNVPPVKIQRFVEDQPVPLEFSVRLQPPLLTWLSYLGIGSTIQLQLAILDAPAGNVMSFVTLDAEPDGVLLRAVGPGLVTANTRAAYTVTLDVAPIIP